MPDIAIKVDKLSKRYRIGLKEQTHDTLVGMLSDFVRRPTRNPVSYTHLTLPTILLV